MIDDKITLRVFLTHQQDALLTRTVKFLNISR
nr:MAG TPA: DNA binding protein [Caudoviricetes sp.]